jgi:hypothetical protein
MWINRLNLLKPQPHGHVGNWTATAFGSSGEDTRLTQTLLLSHQTTALADIPPTSADIALITETKTVFIPFHLENLPLP